MSNTGRALHSVVETAEFLARASRLMSDEERAQVVEVLARNPECGDIFREQVVCERSA
jgi:hypothetical protein